MDNAKAVKNTDPLRTAAVKPATPVIKQNIPPLFRKVDWLTLGITFLFVFVGYCLTLSPEMTLEDSGELATGAYYAGIPHPPGYPVWTIYSWLWTVLVPIKNVAWRVALGSAFAGAVASALLAFVVSRGSSMIIESIDDLKNIPRRLENSICLVAGFVAGTLIGFNGYMWSQAVIVEVYPFSVVSLMGVILCLLRWVYAPSQHRYLYGAFFLYGICFNNHQSLLVIAMGVEVLIWLAEPKLGREMFFWNSMLFLGGAVVQPDILWGNTPVKVIFCTIGLASMALWIWLLFKTQKPWIEIGRDLAMLAAFGCIGLIILGITGYLPKVGEGLFPVFVLTAGTAGAFGWLIRKTWKASREWLVTLGCGGSWLAGAAFYLYMALAGMSNPPMQWGYPRTLDGFIHALTRGQYEKIHPTSGTGENALQVAGNFLTKYSTQLWRALEGVNLEFNILCLLLALVVFLFYRKMKRREKAWIMGMLALFICLGPFLVLLLNFGSDRQSLELCRVFLTASHVFVAMSVGYGLALLAAALSAHYISLRNVAILGGICVVDFAVYLLVINSQVEFDPDLASGLGFIKLLCWLFAATFVVIFWRKGMEQDRSLAIGLTGMCVALSLVPSLLAFTGWPMKAGGFSAAMTGLAEAFKPDHYGLPVYAALILLAAGLVFLLATAVMRNKAPVAITLVLFALMPSYSIMTHWFDNEQHEHWFGYWFGHDMFTPPFPGPDGKLTYDAKLREEALKGPNAKMIYPEMARDAILYGGTDPGRFAPTYMIFCDSLLRSNCLPKVDPYFDRRDVYIITQNALADGTYLEYIRAHYHRSAQKARGLDTPFFQQLFRSPDERNKNWDTNILAKMVSPLDTLFTRIGEGIEKERRAGSSYFQPEDFTDVDGLAKKIAARQTVITRHMYDQLSPATRNLLSGGDKSKLRAALATELTLALETSFYDDKPLAELVDRRWKALLDMEAAEGDIQRLAQLGMVTEAQRLQALVPQLQQIITNCDVEQPRRAEQVTQFLATNGVAVTPHLKSFIEQAPQSFTKIRLNRLLLEAAFPGEIATSLGGVYPDTEIYISSPADSQKCFAEYTADASRRMQHDLQFPNEPRQIRPGEDVRFIDNRVQVSGQIAVMAINGLLTKVIFDHNPDNEFYVEESFPLDWMYMHLLPFGVIMKINRTPVPEITDEIVQRDHEFWSRYSERLIGNWITYDTPVKEIADFAEKVYLRHDFRGFKGDLRFVRDDQSQKAFSKLRSSIATSVYAWRYGLPVALVQNSPKSEAERQRMYKEADFALRQAFAFCPYSPEAVIHYVQLLLSVGRLDDALLVGETAQKLDPFNPTFSGLVQQLKGPRINPDPSVARLQTQVAQLEGEVRANPADFAKALQLAQAYYSLGRVDRTIVILDGILDNPKVDYNSALNVASAYAQLNNVSKAEAALEKLVKLGPDQAEAWYHLASVKMALAKQPEALQHLRHALELNTKARVQNSNAIDLRATLERDPRFGPLHETPEYKAMMAPH